MRAIAREAAKAERERERQRKAEEAAHRRALASAERQYKADTREAKRLYQESRIDEVNDLNSAIDETIGKIQNVLCSALTRNPRQLLEEDLKVKFIPRKFNEDIWVSKIPNPELYRPQPLIPTVDC